MDSPGVRVRYFAAARAVAGFDEENLDLPPGTCVAEVLTVVGGRHGEAMKQVLSRCSYLLDEVAVTAAPTREIRAGSVLDVLPPFAGG